MQADGTFSTELPSSTLHDEVHLDNVLCCMEQFIAPAGLKGLGPVGSALCILVAYTHDVGMMPKPGWRRRLQDPASHDSLSFRGWAAEHHADLLNLRDRCRELATTFADNAESGRLRRYIHDDAAVAGEAGRAVVGDGEDDVHLVATGGEEAVGGDGEGGAGLVGVFDVERLAGVASGKVPASP